MRRLQVLALGDFSHPELREAYETVANSPIATTVSNEANAGSSVDLVLVFQSRPGRVAPALVKTLRSKYPLAGMTTVLGTWCEGENRSVRPSAGIERLYWYQFSAWWQTVAQDWRAGRPTSWQHPSDASRNMALLGEGWIAVDAPDADAAEALLTGCDSLDATAVWTPRWRTRPLGSKVLAGVWIGGQFNSAEESDVAAFRDWLSDRTPLVVLLDFPRRDRVDQARKLGATTVLGKPWRLEQLAVGCGVGGD